MTLKPEKFELALLGAVLLLLAVALWAPAVAQPAHHHAFADQRAWGGVPCAADVLSNLPFLLWGAAGLGLLVQSRRDKLFALEPASRAMAALFFAGLVVTAGASALYHWQPDDAGLAFDRLAMVLAFAGLLGLAAAGRVSARAGVGLAAAVLALGPVSIAHWYTTGNVLPWAVLQLGGMALVLLMAALRPLPDALAVRWASVILIYALAKLFEATDAAVYAATSEWVSGHSLKHVVASFAAWPVLAAMMKKSRSTSEVAAWRSGRKDHRDQRDPHAV